MSMSMSNCLDIVHLQGRFLVILMSKLPGRNACSSQYQISLRWQHIGSNERMHAVQMVADAHGYYLSVIHVCFGQLCM